jgi:hypothetical protein
VTSLRRDIHSAFEVITPPIGGMPERVVRTVLAEQKGRLRKEKMVFRLRVSLALVAAALVIAIGVAAVLEWNALHTSNVSPAGGVHLTSLQELEARPFTIPSMALGDPCTQGPFDNHGRYGSGPAYGIGASPTSTSWGQFWDLHFAISNQVTGLVLIRGRDLKTQQDVLWRGSQAAGPLGDPNQPDLHKEVVYDMGSKAGAGETLFPITSALKAGHGDCVGMQIDGSSFTEKFRGGA